MLSKICKWDNSSTNSSLCDFFFFYLRHNVNFIFNVNAPCKYGFSYFMMQMFFFFTRVHLRNVHMMHMSLFRGANFHDANMTSLWCKFPCKDAQFIHDDGNAPFEGMSWCKCPFVSMPWCKCPFVGMPWCKCPFVGMPWCKCPFVGMSWCKCLLGSMPWCECPLIGMQWCKCLHGSMPWCKRPLSGMPWCECSLGSMLWWEYPLGNMSWCECSLVGMQWCECPLAGV